MAQLQTQLSAEESAAEAEHASFVLGAIGADDAKGGAAGALDPARAEDAMEAELIEVFRRADAGGTGVLSATEFHGILRALDLGLSQYQMARLVAEADENEDGSIS